MSGVTKKKKKKKVPFKEPFEKMQAFKEEKN